MLSLVCGILRLAIWVIIAWIVLSYVVSFGRLGFDHPVRRLYDGLTKAIEPLMRPIRSVIPPVRIGGAALDLSPLILIIGVNLLLVF
ncbi:MAG: YggT family protein, partial [Actinomycetota bacterium]|nr:YggT family protein [Actinomycetota bacterium]